YFSRAYIFLEHISHQLRQLATRLCLLDQVFARLGRQTLSASVATDPLAHLRRTRRWVYAFPVCPPYDPFTAVFNNERMPGADGKTGRITSNMSISSRQRETSRSARTEVGIEHLVEAGLECPPGLSECTFHRANSACVHAGPPLRFTPEA